MGTEASSQRFGDEDRLYLQFLGIQDAECTLKEAGSWIDVGFSLE